MEHKPPSGFRRHHVSLSPATEATLKRLVAHLAVEFPDRRVTASAALRFAIERTAGAIASQHAL